MGMIASRTVLAARLHEHGRPLLVEETAVADPGADEVVVEMAFGGVNPVDRYNALGRVAADGPLPRTLGGEGSGRVEGRPVVIHGHGLGSRRDGLWAERAVVPRAAVTEIPDGVDLAVAAALGVAGVTAWRTVHEKAHVGADDRVLVLGASGGVGSVIVSLARAAGARVWGQTEARAKAGWIEEHGAERAVVARAEDLTAAVADLRPTVVFDPLGDGFTGAAIEALEPFGRLVLFGTSADARGDVPLQLLYRKGLTVYGYGGLIEPADQLQAGLRHALEAVAAGTLEVPIGAVVELADVNDAFRMLEQREHRGKIVLRLAPA